MAKLKFKPKPHQISEWIETNFDFRTRKSGSEYLICNPFDGDTGYNFNISPEKGICHDWRGDEWARGKSRTFLRFVQVYRNCSFTDAVKEVCGKGVSLKALYAKIAKEKQEEEEEQQYDISLPPESSKLIDSQDSLNGKILINWLKNRGIGLDAIERYDLHYHAMYVIWPYYEFGSLVYWQERDRMNKMFRFPPEQVGVTKGMFLYGFDMVEPCQYIIINEAIIDSMTLEDQAIASGGAVLTPMQVKKIRALNPEEGVILAPDNDLAGLKSLVSNYKLLSPYCRVFYSIPPKIKIKSDKYTKDWNDLGKVMPWNDIRKVFEDNIKPLKKEDAVKFMLSGV